MGAIVPAILPTTREDLEGKLAMLEGLVDTVQIDIVDGKFAGQPTWPYTDESEEFARRVHEGSSLPYLGTFRYEVDLMVENAEEVTGLWIAAGAQRLVVHAESSKQLPKIISDLQVKYGHAKDFTPDLLSFGLSIGNDTDLSTLEPYIKDIDFVQFMGIANIGMQGEPFDERVLERVRTFRNLHPEMTIQVDGAVSLETAPKLLSAGVDRLVVGSALFRAPNLRDAIKRFKTIVLEHSHNT